MTEPTRPDAVPPAPPDEDSADPGTRYADLEHRPVSEHVAVFEAEHATLQRELGSIDQV